MCKGLELHAPEGYGTILPDLRELMSSPLLGKVLDVSLAGGMLELRCETIFLEM